VFAKAALRRTPLGVPGNWTLKFDDEFNGTSLDLSKWQPNWLGPNNTATTPSPNGSEDLNCMAPSQVSEAKGVLRLRAVQRNCTADNGAVYPYASGLVNTYKSFRFTYGFVQARIYVPESGTVPVNFPAFWTDGTGTWPHTGELDVFEVLRSCGPGLGYHFHSDSGGPGGCVSLSNPGGWHTFGADWQPGVVTYYYDGHQVGQITTGITGSPMYLILNNSVDPTSGGAVSAPRTLNVDYVSVWQ
jgi:beta-glucanase (GH16 family)